MEGTGRISNELDANLSIEQIVRPGGALTRRATPHWGVALNGSSPDRESQIKNAILMDGVFYLLRIRTRTIKCDSPGFTRDIFTGEECRVYLLSICQDFLRYSSIYPGNRYHF